MRRKKEGKNRKQEQLHNDLFEELEPNFFGTHAKIKSTIDDSYATADRSLKIVEQTKSLGEETLNTLQFQGEQLKNIQGNVDDVLESEEKAKRHLASIRSLFMTVINYFRPNAGKIDNVSKGDKLIQKNRKKNANAKNKKKKGKVGAIIMEEYVDMSMLDKEDVEKNTKTNKILDKIGDGVDDLKEIALSMGHEVEEQNARLAILKETTMEAGEEMRTLKMGVSNAS